MSDGPPSGRGDFVRHPPVRDREFRRFQNGIAAADVSVLRFPDRSDIHEQHALNGLHIGHVRVAGERDDVGVRGVRETLKTRERPVLRTGYSLIFRGLPWTSRIRLPSAS